MYAVRIHYPDRKGRAGKRDLVVSKPSRPAAVAYAKKVAKRGVLSTAGMNRAERRWARSGPGYSVKANAPTACVYNLKKWGSKPVCFSAGWHESKRASVVRAVPYTER